MPSHESESKLNRRTALAEGLSLAMVGFLFADLDPETSAEDETRAKRPRRRRPVREETWKYTRIDPELAARYAYETYHPWGCMYAAAKGGMLAYADANPEMAPVVKAFPFLAFRSGKTGCGAMEQLCGTINGAAFFMSLFVPDYAELCALIVKLAEFYKTTELPSYVPAEDKYPNFVKTIAPSLQCADSKGKWLAADPSQEHKQLRQERCIRLTASVIKKAVELLNEYFEKLEAEKQGSEG